jgi:starvation-inducible DNA-binding protein
MSTNEIVPQLNSLLCNLQLFYQNVRGFHWYTQGQTFFELHQKFEELYTYLFEYIDEVAERVATLGGQPTFAPAEIQAQATIPVATDLTNGTENLRQSLESLKVLIANEKKLLATAAQANDYGTLNLMQEHIAKQEKLVWLYTSYLTE